jgi:predicted MFS family arabinose efflux permease
MTATSSWLTLPRQIFALALGTFAIGTEGFMIAPLLTGIASDLGVRISTAGQLVTVFALTYAFSSPVLTALTGRWSRHRLLIGCLAAFAIANVVAWAASGYWTLMVARILLALTAGLYVPNANAVAAALVPPERRGHALSIISGGTSLAIALGVPLGAMLGHSLGWRTTFAAVALLAASATIGLTIGLRRGIDTNIPAVTLVERLAVVRNRTVLQALAGTTLWAAGAYTLYTYVAVYLSATAALTGSAISLLLFIWGVSAAVGVFAGGALTDKVGPRRVIVPALMLLTMAFLGLWVCAAILSPAHAVLPVVIGVVAWGMSAWAFFPAQQTRLVRIAGLPVASIVLSLNASFMFIGFAAGAALGALVLSHGSPANLGWVAAICEVAALLTMLADDS